MSNLVAVFSYPTAVFFFFLLCQKRAVIEAQVLSFHDYKLPFTLCTDASALDIGAALIQTVEGNHPHVIAYASRTLTHAKLRFSVTHMEALAVVWTHKHFHDIIFGYPVTVYTDHSAVLQLFKGKNLS